MRYLHFFFFCQNRLWIFLSITWIKWSDNSSHEGTPTSALSATPLAVIHMCLSAAVRGEQCSRRWGVDRRTCSGPRHRAAGSAPVQDSNLTASQLLPCCICTSGVQVQTHVTDTDMFNDPAKHTDHFNGNKTGRDWLLKRLKSIFVAYEFPSLH